jgi:nucleoside phosphorylase
MLAICAALRWEIAPILQELGPLRRESHEGVRVWTTKRPDRRVVVYRTGVGTERAAAATERILWRFPVSALINTGCAGALIPGLEPGTLVIPWLLQAPGKPRETRIEADRRWVARLHRLAAGRGLPTDPGPILTSPVPLPDAAAKAAAHAESGAHAVDMEGAAVGAVAQRAGLPFASIRSVLDDLCADVAPFVPRAGLVGPIDRLRLHWIRAGRPAGFKVLTLVEGVWAMRASLRAVFHDLLEETDLGSGIV